MTAAPTPTAALPPTLYLPPANDPWLEALAPALEGHRGAALRGVKRLDRPGADAESRVVAARTLWALGMPGPASALLDRALAEDSPDARRLASVARPAPGEALQARLRDPDPGERADAGCDQAWRALRAGDVPAARRAVDRALADCPHHAEARRWHRFLVEAGPGAPRCLRALAPPSLDPGARDAWALAPVARRGWLSHERWKRRVRSGAWPRPAVGGTALARLQREGVVTRVLGMDVDYAGLPFDHPLAVAERALDRALSAEEEGHDPAEAAADAWMLAARVDARAVRDAASALVALGVRRPTAARTGLAAAELLRHTAPHRCIWAAYRARLLARAGHPHLAAAEARAVLARGDLDPVSFGLAVGSLRAAGLTALAAHVCEAAASTADLGPAAAWLQAHPTEDLAPIVTDRIRPRGLPGSTTDTGLLAQ